MITTFVVTTQMRPVLMSNRPLPGDGSVVGQCAVWFVGSSTIARWKTLKRDMSPWQTENRGIGGALIGEITTRFDASELSGPPGMLVLLAGDNDLAAGADVNQIAAAITQFVIDVRRQMPRTLIIVLGVKPSPTRWGLRDQQLRLDMLIRQGVASQPLVSFADTGSSLLLQARPGPYFVGDGIHLSDDGYSVWGRAVRRAVEDVVPPAMAKHCAGQSSVRA